MTVICSLDQYKEAEQQRNQTQLFYFLDSIYFGMSFLFGHCVVSKLFLFMCVFVCSQLDLTVLGPYFAA